MSNLYKDFLFVRGQRRASAEEIRRVFTTYCLKYQLRITFNQYRHAVKAFTNAHLGDEAEAAKKSIQAIYDQQMGHSSRTAGDKYARLTSSYLRLLGSDKREVFHRCSIAWQNLIMRAQEAHHPQVRVGSRIPLGEGSREEQTLREVHIKETVHIYPRSLDFPTGKCTLTCFHLCTLLKRLPSSAQSSTM